MSGKDRIAAIRARAEAQYPSVVAGLYDEDDGIKQLIVEDIPYLIGLLEAAENACRWIPVSEKLPEDDPDIPKHSESHFEFCTIMAAGYYAGSDKLSVCQTNRMINRRTGIEYVDREAKVLDEWYWGSSFERVTHWMPLPEAPEENKNPAN